MDTLAEGDALSERVVEGLKGTNIKATLDVIVRPESSTALECIRARSKKSDLVFLGLARIEQGAEAEAAERLQTLVEDLPSVILVRNSSPFRGRLV